MNKLCMGLLPLALSACGPSSGGSASDASNQPTSDGGPTADAHMPQYCDKMDLVFVIDNSDSMEEEQANLIANFPGFIQVLDQFDTMVEGRDLDYRVAVTTTSRQFSYKLMLQSPPIEVDMDEEGDSGAFRQPEACAMTRPWIERGDSDVAGTFACVANVGVGGSRFEMPLYMTELALSARVVDGVNDGFLREDALLGVVILTDADDCSRSDEGFTVTNVDSVCYAPNLNTPAGTVTFLDDLKGSRKRWASAVIAGPGPGDCTSDLSNAENAVRLQDFVAVTGDNAVFSSICQDDLAGALSEALATFSAACESFDPID